MILYAIMDLKLKKKLLKYTLQKMKKVFVIASLNVYSSLLVNSSLIIVTLNWDFGDVLTTVYNNGKLIIFFCVTHWSKYFNWKTIITEMSLLHVIIEKIN